MKLFNFTIEEDRNWYILTEYGKYKTGDNIGETYIADTTYPSTLKRALEKVRHRVRSTATKSKTVKEYIEKTEQLNDEFLTELSKMIEWLK